MAKRARRTWLLIVIGLAALIVVGGGIALRPNIPLLTWAIRTAAVLGYLCVFVAALSSIYMRELVRWFGRPFVKTHHVVTVTGLILITLQENGSNVSMSALTQARFQSNGAYVASVGMSPTRSPNTFATTSPSRQSNWLASPEQCAIICTISPSPPSLRFSVVTALLNCATR